MTRVNRRDIAEALVRLGIVEGMNVFVHSSLRSIGEVTGGADAVVGAFLDVLGPDGTLMVPTFTFSRTTVFDVRRSPSCTGAITEAARRHPDAVRSWHPSHASCAVGPRAAWLMHDHLLYGPLAVGSPEDRMAKIGGFVLLLGVEHTVNSTVHVGEAYAGAPARRAHFNPLNPARMHVVAPDGSSIDVALTDMPGCSQGFGAIEGPLRAAGHIRDGVVGEARCQLMRGKDVIHQTVALLDRDPYALMCDNPDCGTCTRARHMLDEQLRRAPSDRSHREQHR